jgi:hypothetical protein
MIDLTGDSDMDVDPPVIDHTITIRADILREYVGRSQTRSPAKAIQTSLSIPRSPQQNSSFLDMVRSRRGIPVASQPPPQDTEAQGHGVGRVEDDVSSERTHESSTVGVEVCFYFHPYCLTTSFIYLRFTPMTLPWPSSPSKIPEYWHPHHPAPSSKTSSPLLHITGFLISPPLSWTTSMTYLTPSESPLFLGKCLRQSLLKTQPRMNQMRHRLWSSMESMTSQLLPGSFSIPTSCGTMRMSLLLTTTS